VVTRTRSNRAEITSERLQGVALKLDLTSRTEAEAPKNRQGRAPALHGVLEEERGHRQGQGKPPSIRGQAQHRSGERQRRGVGLQRPLDVPLRVELAQPATDVLRVLGMPARSAAMRRLSRAPV